MEVYSASLFYLKSPTMKTLSIDYSEFVDRFRPLMRDESLVDVDPRLGEMDNNDFKDAIDARRIWTLVDTDTVPLIVSGFHFVNRLEHYLCDVPVEVGVEYVENGE